MVLNHQLFCRSIRHIHNYPNSVCTMILCNLCIISVFYTTGYKTDNIRAELNKLVIKSSGFCTHTTSQKDNTTDWYRGVLDRNNLVNIKTSLIKTKWKMLLWIQFKQFVQYILATSWTLDLKLTKRTCKISCGFLPLQVICWYLIRLYIRFFVIVLGLSFITSPYTNCPNSETTYSLLFTKTNMYYK